MSTQFFCGVDLAKHRFSLHAVDEHGKVILHEYFSRVNLLNVKSYVSRLAPSKADKFVIITCVRDGSDLKLDAQRRHDVE
ncbi:hypothetical protein BZG82_00880 [Salinivibrio sp. PR5]|nr:hypothetical protein BZG82_00880 [Salinivibrio sp. PR5]